MFEVKNNVSDVVVVSLMLILNMFFIPLSSVTISDSEHEIFAGLRLLDHRSDTFFTCILFSLYILCFYIIILSKNIFVSVN